MNNHLLRQAAQQSMLLRSRVVANSIRAAFHAAPRRRSTKDHNDTSNISTQTTKRADEGTRGPGQGPKTLTVRLKDTMTRYGKTATAFHSTVYVATLGVTFVAVSNGLDSSALLTSIGVDDSVIPSGAGEAAASWALCAVTGPPRSVLTIVATPVVSRWWTSRQDVTSP
jgi:hypothetical protein